MKRFKTPKHESYTKEQMREMCNQFVAKSCILMITAVADEMDVDEDTICKIAERTERYAQYEHDHLIRMNEVSEWIPFKTRPLTKEEKEEHPEWDGILDCKLPDDGQRILVSVSVRGHESVQYDEFYTDDGSYLDSGYEIGTEATAWMPLPEPYKAESEDKE